MDEDEWRRERRSRMRRMTWPWSASWNELTGCCAGRAALYAVAVLLVGVILYFFVSWLTR